MEFFNFKYILNIFVEDLKKYFFRYIIDELIIIFKIGSYYLDFLSEKDIVKGYLNAIYFLFHCLFVIQTIVYLSDGYLANLWDISFLNSELFSILEIFFIIFVYYYIIFLIFAVETKIILDKDSYFYLLSVFLALDFIFIFNTILFKYKSFFFAVLIAIIFVLLLYMTSISNFLIEIYRMAIILVFNFFQNMFFLFTIKGLLIVSFMIFWFGMLAPLFFSFLIKKFIFKYMERSLSITYFFINLSYKLRIITQLFFGKIIYYILFLVCPVFCGLFFKSGRLPLFVLLVVFIQIYLIINVFEKILLESPNYLLDLYEKSSIDEVNFLMEKVDLIVKFTGSNENFYVNSYFLLFRNTLINWAINSRTSFEQEIIPVLKINMKEEIYTAYKQIELTGSILEKEKFDVFCNKILSDKDNELDLVLLKIFIDFSEQHWLEVQFKMSLLWSDLLNQKWRVDDNVYFIIPQNYNLLCKFLLI